MTIVLVAPPDCEWASPLADELRARGRKVVRIATVSIIGFLLASQRIAVVIVHHDRVPAEWDTMLERMQRIAPRTKVIVAPRGTRPNIDDIIAS